MSILLFQASCRWHSDMLMDKTNITPCILQLFVIQIKKNMNSCYILSFFVSFSVCISLFLFIFFFPRLLFFFQYFVTTLNVYMYGKASFFPIYERNVPSHELHVRNKTENDVGRHAGELILSTQDLKFSQQCSWRHRSWKVKPRQLINSYKEFRRIVLR